MKQWIFNIILLAVLAPSASAFPFTEFKKEIRKEYTVANDAIVGVANKYGKVEVHTWNKPVASFQVIITVNANDQKRADEIFQTISIHFSHNPGEVRAITEIENKPKSVWSWWWSSGESAEFNIDYVVYIPNKGRVDINNQYGDILIDELANNANIDLKYGNLRLAGSTDKVEFTLGYSKAKVGNTAGMKGIAKYSTIKLDATSNMECETKYSKVEVGSANDMRINSKYDTYVIGKVRSIENEGKYDDFEIEEADVVVTNTAYTDWEIQLLNQMADVDMRYGELKIFKVGPGCEKIDFNGDYAHIRLYVDPASAFQFDLRSRYGEIHLPENVSLTNEIRDGQSQAIKGYYRNPNAKMVLNADIAYGGVTVR